MSEHRELDHRWVHLRFDRPEPTLPAPSPPFQEILEESDDGSELAVAPSEGPSADEIRAQAQAEELRQIQSEPAEAYEPTQFSVRELFAAITVFAVLCAGLHWLPTNVFAFLAGLLALIGMAAIHWLQPRRVLVQIFWWPIMAAYLIAIVLAIKSGK